MDEANSTKPAARPGWVFAFGLFLCAFVGVMDYETGHEISFSIFYLLPVLWVSWYSDRRQAIAISLISALVSLWADTRAGHSYRHALIPVWNATVRMAFFWIISHYVARTRQLLMQMTELSYVDPLTKAANGRHFHELLDLELSKAKRHGRPLSLVYIDIDNFKAVNDTLGHGVGDTLLQVVSETVRGGIRVGDVFARLGGDEFALILPEASKPQSLAAITKLKSKLLDTVRGRNWPVTFSFGVITCEAPSCTPDELVKRADSLMYEGKKSGKNKIIHGQL